MRALAASAALVLLAACATTSDDGPVTSPPPAAAPDPRVGEMQTSLTELLERIDVLNDRIARLEETRPATPAQPAERSVERAAPVERPAPAVERPAPAQTAERPAPAQPSASAQSALAGANLADAYRKAIMLYGRNSLAEARREFQQVFDTDPTGDLADNALFWIGETYYAANDYTNAMRYYSRVWNEFSDQNKAPDALFKTALAQEKTGDLALAKKTLQQVIARYPYSSPASTAKQELQRIKY
jgi:tol-pal system protein YbgF